MKLTRQEIPEKQAKQEIYRDARFTKQYDGIWKAVGKCVFCDLREKYVFFEEHGVVMTISLYAYIDGHFMIMPRRHIRSAKDLTQLEWDTVRKFSYIAKKLIKAVHGVKGMQLVQKDGSSAQSTVDQHLHFHCIPFDAPDLTVWNFRQLKYTPLENVALYKQAAKKIAGLDRKYDQKYAKPSGLPIICDAVILDKDQRVLLQERAVGCKFTPDYLTLPGGGVERYDVALETELAREVREETGIELSEQAFELIDSRPGSMTRTRTDEHLHITYPVENQFLWNTYLVRKPTTDAELTAGDDCASLLWMDIPAVLKHERISPGIRAVLRKVQKVIIPNRADA